MIKFHTVNDRGFNDNVMVGKVTEHGSSVISAEAGLDAYYRLKSENYCAIARQETLIRWMADENN